MKTQVKLFPDWKQAVDDAISEFTYGGFISKQWLYDHLNMHPPKQTNFEEYEKFTIAFMSAMANFKGLLLEEHKMLLKNVRGKGYVIVIPKHHTGIAFNTMKSGLVKHIKKGYTAMTNINYNLLTTEERQQNSDKLATLSSLNSMMRRRIDLGDK